VPRVATTAGYRDVWGTIGARIGLIRSHHRVVPGLYAVGTPGPDSAVLVTANYKLSFDALRFQLSGINAWLLVIDTRGINVWCAAGKGTFSTEEVILSVNRYQVAQVTSHRQLVLPQLSATGVAAQEVKRQCGFQVLFGPVRAADLPAYLEHNKQCDEAMRTVTFTLSERAILIPVELWLLAKPVLFILILAFLLSGICPTVFSLSLALNRGLILLGATALGIAAGAVLMPLMLPWLPFRQFWLKGILSGFAAAACSVLLYAPRIVLTEKIAMALWVVTISSHLAMNFTGSTPFTSPSGVEYEMRRGMPIQIGATCLTVFLWAASPFW
jgi:hypothetical protein